MKMEIKFRAWDGEKMVHPDYITRDGRAYWKENSIPTASNVIMQFTGLHDKNGKEIYDADIVRIHYFKIGVGENLGVIETEAELLGVIEITPLALVLKNIIGEKWCEYTGYEQGEGECKVFHLHDVYEGSFDAEWQIEVIGNIYENPELLK